MAAGIDPNSTDMIGRTPLHHAADRAFVEGITALLDAGSDPLHRHNYGLTPLQYAIYSNKIWGRFLSSDVITVLVAAGDRSWESVPTPCRGLEAAMLSVWQNAPDEMPELVKRLDYNPPKNLAELFPRMDDDEMKKVVQEVLRVLHHHFSSYPHLKEQLLNSIFGLPISI